MSQFSSRNQGGSSALNVYENNPLLCQFYEALLMLDVFYADPGDPFSEEGMPGSEAEEDPSNLSEKQLRREFIRHLAYLCSYDKGGAPVTAIAIRQAQTAVTYWIASNKIPESPHVTEWGVDGSKEFLLGILITLQAHLSSNTESKLFSMCVEFSTPRIAKYIEPLRDHVRILLTSAAHFSSNQGNVPPEILEMYKSNSSQTNCTSSLGFRACETP